MTTVTQRRECTWCPKPFPLERRRTLTQGEPGGLWAEGGGLHRRAQVLQACTSARALGGQADREGARGRGVTRGNSTLNAAVDQS